MIPLSQSIPCANTFIRGTLANVRSKAMNVTRGDGASGASRPSDKYDKPWCKSHSRISTIAYNLTTRATVRRYHRRFAKESSTMTRKAGDCNNDVVAVFRVLELTPACDSIGIWENETSAPKKMLSVLPAPDARNAHRHSHPRSTWSRFPKRFEPYCERKALFCYI